MPMVTGVRRDQRPNGQGSKGQGPDGQCKASVNPAAAASLSAANWQGNAKAPEAFGTIGRSGGPFRWAAQSSAPFEGQELQKNSGPNSKFSLPRGSGTRIPILGVVIRDAARPHAGVRQRQYAAASTKAAVKRENTNHWRAIARVGCGCSVNASAPPSIAVRGQPTSSGKIMNRDDVLVWLSFVWFVVLCGAAIWVLFAH